MDAEGFDFVPLYAALAMNAMVEGDVELAESWLRKLTRASRGRVKIALDDLDMMISRMGKSDG